MSFCPHCGATAGPGALYCATCGRPMPGIVAQPPPAPAPLSYSTEAPSTPPPYAPAPAPERKVSEGMGIAALILNILVWPGLGSLIAGAQKGWAQGFLFLGGLILTLTLIGAILGIPMMIGAWIWGIVTGIELVQGRAG